MYEVGPALFYYFNVNNAAFGLGHFDLGQFGLGCKFALARFIERHDVHYAG